MKLVNSELKVIRPSGILNSSMASQLCDVISEALKHESLVILIDLNDVAFIDSSGLGGLVNSFKVVRSQGGRLVLCSLSEQARMLLEITGMDQVFEIYSSQADFTNTQLEIV